MLRTTLIALTFSLISGAAVAPAQADTVSLTQRVHDAAVKACAPERISGMTPSAHYGAIDEQCVYRLSHAAMARAESQAAAGAASKVANK